MEVAGGLEVLDTNACWLAAHLALGDLAPATTTANTDAVDDVALLGLVTHATSLVGTGGTGRTVDGIKLAVLPASDAEDKAEDVGLLFLVDFF